MAEIYNDDRDPLHHTVETGNKKEILHFLKYDTVDLGVIDSNGNTVLHLVIKNKKLLESEILQLSELFIRLGINPNIENYSQETALQLAVTRRIKDVAEFLMYINDETNIIDSRKNLITHFLEVEYRKFSQKLGPGPVDLRNNNLKDWNIEEMEIESANFVEWLISKGCDFDSHDENKQSAVFLAIQYNLQHILLVLLKHTNYMHYISHKGESLLCSFLSRNYKPGKYFEKFYQKRYSESIIRMILDKGIHIDIVDNTGRTALQIAIEQEVEMSTINLLIDSYPKNCDKSNVATSRFYHIMCSCQSWDSRTDCYLKILSDLLAKGANLNYQNKHTGTAPLYFAVKCKNLRALQFLQENGANLKVKTKNGQNLLFQVIEQNENVEPSNEVESLQLKIFEILVNAGCEVNTVDEDGLSPLHLAARLNNMPILLRLIELGADVNCKTVNKTTPLHYAFAKPVNAVEVCKLLVDHGADVNAKNCWGTRPIHLVSNVKGVKDVDSVLNILVGQGADINALNDYGESLLYRAILQNQRSAFIKELLKWGANVNDRFVTDFMYEGNFRESSRSLLIKHWLALNLETIMLPCVIKYRSFLFFMKYRCQGFRAQYFEELNLLKAYMINSRTSLYCFLCMHPSDGSAYCKNEKVLSIIDSPVIQEQFPIHSNSIVATYREAASWKALLELAKVAWLDLTGIRLPDVCIKLIFDYFDNAELMKVIDRNTSHNGKVGAFKLLYEKDF